MLIDCDSCSARDISCADCVISVLLGGPPGPVDLDRDERVALVRLADAGLVPPLRLASDPPPLRSVS